MPAPEVDLGKSPLKSRYARLTLSSSTAALGNVMDKLRELGLDKNTLVHLHHRQRRMAGRLSRRRILHPTVERKAPTVKAARVSPPSPGGPVMSSQTRATATSSAASTSWPPSQTSPVSICPKNDRDGKPIIFDSYDMTPVLLGTGKSKRDSWFYFTENELTPGAARVGRFKAEFNIRGDDGQATGGLAVDSNLGWKGPEKYVATVPQIYDLWADPQERYDIFMNNFTEHTWTLVTINASVKELMKTYVQYPPRKLQSEGYSGPITLTQYQRFAYIREALQKDDSTSHFQPGTEPMSLPEEGMPGGTSS